MNGYVNGATRAQGQPVPDTSLVTAADPGLFAIAAGSTTAQLSYAADTYTGGGTSTYSVPTQAIDTSGVADPAPQAVYQNERYTSTTFSSFSYNVGGLTPGASYTVRLDFSENFDNGPGVRLFNVLINGVQVLTNFDIYAQAGAKFRAIVQYLPATARSDGTVQITFSGTGHDTAKVDGVAITPDTAAVAAVGQDGNDFVGSAYPNAIAPPDGFADEHLALTGLLPQAIDYITVYPYGGGAVYTGPSTTFNNSQNLSKAILARAPGSPTGDLYFEAGYAESGYAAPGLQTNVYHVAIKYVGISSPVTVNVAGGFNDPNLPKYTTPTSHSRTSSDYDGDGKTDYAIFDPVTRTIYRTYSQQSFPIGATDTLIPLNGDYDGDGRTDYGVYDQTTATFYVYYSSTNNLALVTQQLGNSADYPMPVCGDYDGDGKTDFAVFDTVTQTIYRQFFSQSFRTFPGNPISTTDILIPLDGDYDGDRKTDYGVYDQTKTIFYIYSSSPNTQTTIVQQLGNSKDRPVPVCGDYDGDGKTDFAIYETNQTGNDTFYLRFSNLQLGAWADNSIPLNGDYNGDGVTDFAIYDPSQNGNATFFFQFSSAQLGAWADNPFPIDGYIIYAYYKRLRSYPT